MVVIEHGRTEIEDAASVAWFAPDTNFFLQCKWPDELDWTLVTQAKEIVLISMRDVQREIDELKGDGNHRRAGRARKVASIFGGLLDTNSVHVYREADPRIILRRAPRLDPQRPGLSGFDLNSPDDRIVEQAMATAAQLAKPIVLLTDDSGPLQTAHDVGQAFKKMPNEWRLPPEPDTDSKKIQALERQIRELTSRMPKLDVAVLVDGEPKTNIIAKTFFYKEASDALRSNVMGVVRSKFPGVRIPNDQMEMMMSSEGIHRYNSELSKWYESLNDSIDSILRRTHATKSAYQATIRFVNAGSSSAEGVVVEVRAEGDFAIVSPELLKSLDVKAKAFKDPPAYPAKSVLLAQKLMERSAGIQFYNGPSPFIQATRVAKTRPARQFGWSWLEDDSLKTYCRGECEDFRHAIQTEDLIIPLWVPVEHEGDAKGRLIVTASARNLAQPVVHHIPVMLYRQPGDVEPEVRRHLEADLHIRIPNILPDA